MRAWEPGEREDLGLGIVHQRAELGEPGGELVSGLIPGGVDLGWDSALDEFLHHQANRLADQIHAVTGTERIEQFGQGRLGTRPSVVSFSASLGRFTPKIPPMAAYFTQPRRTSNPHHSRGRSSQASLRVASDRERIRSGHGESERPIFTRPRPLSSTPSRQRLWSGSRTFL